MIIPNETLDGVSSTPTSSYPYESIGPIDFKNLNLVRTEQTDYYYGPIQGSSGTVLLSKVTQIYDPTFALVTICVMIFVILSLLGYGIHKMKKS